MTPYNDTTDPLNAFFASDAAPLVDDGFTAQVMAAHREVQISHMQKQVRLRRLWLNGACFVGGVIAAAQLPKLWGLLQTASAKMPTLAVPDIDLAPNAAILTNPNYALIGGVFIAALMVWVWAKDGWV